jgi:hypothetical protein
VRVTGGVRNAEVLGVMCKWNHLYKRFSLRMFYYVQILSVLDITCNDYHFVFIFIRS